MVSSVKAGKILVTFNLTIEEKETLCRARNILEEMYGTLPEFNNQFDFADETEKVEVHSNTGFVNDLIYLCSEFLDYLNPEDSNEWIKVDY